MEVNFHIFRLNTNPIILRKTKILFNFCLSECNRVKLCIYWFTDAYTKELLQQVFPSADIDQPLEASADAAL